MGQSYYQEPGTIEELIKLNGHYARSRGLQSGNPKAIELPKTNVKSDSKLGAEK